MLDHEIFVVLELVVQLIEVGVEHGLLLDFL